VTKQSSNPGDPLPGGLGAEAEDMDSVEAKEFPAAR
jgi:hypothetical protein